MPLSHFRFTIRSLMIAVVVVAGLLSLRNVWTVIVIALSLSGLALIVAQWLISRGHRQFTSAFFWVPASLTNALYAAACIRPDVYLLIWLFLGWLLIVLPMIAAFGPAWVILATRKGVVPRRRPLFAWLAVAVLSVLPAVTLWTLWPLHTAFLTARPALDRLADRCAAGQAVSYSQRVGLFRIGGAAVDPMSGNVGLMVDPNPNGPTGFVRVCPGPSPKPNRTGPFAWDDLDVYLGWRWEYREED
jgi:hypothetical protein